MATKDDIAATIRRRNHALAALASLNGAVLTLLWESNPGAAAQVLALVREAQDAAEMACTWAGVKPLRLPPGLSPNGNGKAPAERPG